MSKLCYYAQRYILQCLEEGKEEVLEIALFLFILTRMLCMLSFSSLLWQKQRRDGRRQAVHLAAPCTGDGGGDLRVWRGCRKAANANTIRSPRIIAIMREARML